METSTPGQASDGLALRSGAVCEDTLLVDGGVMTEGAMSTKLGLKGWPTVADATGASWSCGAR